LPLTVLYVQPFPVEVMLRVGTGSDNFIVGDAERWP